MSRKGMSREEISKQFDLPERKSKIATLMKHGETAYCICRSSDSERFMICCDACEEWYHGDCIGISEKASKDIKRYFCDRCRLEDPSLKTRYKTPKAESEGRKSREGCQNCSNCLRREDCGQCPGCNSHRRCLHKICLQTRARGRDASPEWAPPSPISKRRRSATPPRKSSRDKKDRKRAKSKKEKDASKSHRSKRRKDSADSREDLEEKYPEQQCYGPQCINMTRPGSKYCSDTCGMKLAMTRIFQVLPQRIQEWSLTPNVADRKNKQALESVRVQLRDVRASLKELDDRHLELDDIIERGKQCKVEDSEDREEEEGGTETTFYCITCGHEIHSRTAIRHMDKCFNKYEAQASFGSIYKTRIQGNNMFCDFFNSTNATYCKRLRVLCPEHNKEPKADPSEVCGYPLVTNVFSKTGSFCRASKLNCMRHYAWEKIWRAEIDMERVRQWLKVDELVEKEREIRNELSNRGGVLSLLLHSTHDHDEMERLAAYNQG